MVRLILTVLILVLEVLFAAAVILVALLAIR
jgi:hypothetical protein